LEMGEGMDGEGRRHVREGVGVFLGDGRRGVGWIHRDREGVGRVGFRGDERRARGVGSIDGERRQGVADGGGVGSRSALHLRLHLDHHLLIRLRRGRKDAARGLNCGNGDRTHRRYDAGAPFVVRVRIVERGRLLRVTICGDVGGVESPGRFGGTELLDETRRGGM
jgi:hypothetical protein